MKSYTQIHKAMSKQRLIIMNKSQAVTQANYELDEARRALTTLKDIYHELEETIEQLAISKKSEARLDHQLELLEYVGDNQPVNLTSSPSEWGPNVIQDMNRRGLITQDTNGNWSLGNDNLDDDDRLTDIDAGIPFIEVQLHSI